MKRIKQLGDGTFAGSNVFDENGRECYVVKIKARVQVGEEGNVLIRDIETGEERWVLGSKINYKPDLMNFQLKDIQY